MSPPGSAVRAMPAQAAASLNGSMDTMYCCPACGQPHALIALGTRRDRPHRWRWWVTTRTYLYLCNDCDALVELAELPGTVAATALRIVRPAKSVEPVVAHPPLRVFTAPATPVALRSPLAHAS